MGRAGSPSAEEQFREIFADGLDVPPEWAARLVVYLGVRIGRCPLWPDPSATTDASSGQGARTDPRDLVAQAQEIGQRDLSVIRP